MIQGKPKTEASYRAIQMDSSSSLKEFSVDRRKYHKKYVLNEKSEDESDSQAAIMGRIVETQLMEPDEFDNRFYMSSCATSPTGLMLEFVNALYKHTAAATDEFGNVSRSFEDIAKDAYVDSGFKIKFDAVINKFVGSDAEIFYNELRKVKANNLTVVTIKDLENANKIVEALKTSPVTSYIVNKVNSARWEVINQFQVEGYVVDEHTFKSMMDKIVIDHENKTIQVYDLKCVWAVENFYEEYYLYRRAYIQAYLYHRAILNSENIFNFDHSDYEVLYPKFIVCDSTNYYSPLIYTLDVDDMDAAYNGFEHKGRKYPGVKSLIADMIWARDHDVWNISRENYLNHGVVKLRG